MNIELRSQISEAHWHYLTGWSERVFPVEGLGKEWAAVQWHIVAYDDNALPMAHLGFGRFVIGSGGDTREVVGVGGVVVRPEYQGQGVPKSLFEALYRHAPEQLGLDSYTLFCPTRLVPYYRKHGYTRYEGLLWFQQRGQLVKSDFEFMYRGLELPPEELKIPSIPW